MAGQAIEVRRYTTHDPAEAHETLTELYGMHRPSFSGDRDHFEFRLLFRDAGELGADTIRHTMATRSIVDPLGYFLAVDVLRGALSLESGRELRRLGHGGIACHPTDAALTLTWDDIDAATVRLPMTLLNRVAAERTGWVGHRLQFEGSAPVSTTLGYNWRVLSQFLRFQLAAQDSVLNNLLVQAHTVEAVAATALATFRNTTMALDRGPGPGRMAPAALRRAAGYIEANAHAPITLTDVAVAAGASVRSLQSAFRRHYDTTPTGYLRQVRLERAHRDLVVGDPHTSSVAAIAARWGFAHPARFAAYYREQYGLPPSQTLRG